MSGKHLVVFQWHVSTGFTRWSHFLNRLFSFCRFAERRNPLSHWLVSLLTIHNPYSPPPSPSVWFLQESNKRRVWCCISQGRDPYPTLWQRQTHCWGLIYPVNRGKNQQSAWSVIPAATNRLTLWPKQLIYCREIQSDAYCTKQRRQVIWGDVHETLGGS